MKPFYLVETTTRDKLIHQGIFYRPENPGKKALLWVHGLTSTFYGSIFPYETLVSQCEKNGLGFAAFNNRGHDGITSIKKEDHRKTTGYHQINGGAGFEIFKETIYDIDAGISFLIRRGFTQIILLGHSTGANKVCYYAGSEKDKRVVGVILASPTSDRLNQKDKTKLAKDLQYMQELVNKGQGNELQIGLSFFPMTPKRYLSLFTPNSLEDQFDYGDPRPRMKYFSKIKQPLLVILGSFDESLDRPAKEVINVFDSYQNSSSYKSVIIKDATHGYTGKEKEFVQHLFDWITSLG